MSTYLFLPDVLRRIERALVQKEPLSLVRIGDGEHIVLAQKSIWPMKKELREPWAQKSRRGQKGVTLPNLKVRNEIVHAIRTASIVGILPRNDTTIKAPAYLKRKLTDQVFKLRLTSDIHLPCLRQPHDASEAEVLSPVERQTHSDPEQKSAAHQVVVGAPPRIASKCPVRFAFPDTVKSTKH